VGGLIAGLYQVRERFELGTRGQLKAVSIAFLVNAFLSASFDGFEVCFYHATLSKSFEGFSSQIFIS
jgi:hypothetical protein